MDLKSLQPEKIIVRMPNWVGDLVMATPLLSDLRKHFPRAEITAMCRGLVGELLEKDQDIDELYHFTKHSESFQRRIQRRNVIEKLNKGAYDLGILFTNSFSSAWLFWQGKVKVRLGYDCHWRRFLLNAPVTAAKDKSVRHHVITYKKLLEPLGITVSDTKPRLFLSKEEIDESKEILYQRGYQRGKTLIGMNPGAAYGSAKCWLPQRFREACRRLVEDVDTYVVFFGDAKVATLVKNICNGLCPRVINLAGIISLRELASIIHDCDVLLTNDSGPMHIASALGTPLVALFGATDEKQTGPYNQGRVINKNVECSPCFKRVCPIDFKCMKEISVDEVLDLVKEQIHEKNASET